MTLADRIVVLNNGIIEQVGTPMELYNNPANQFVAGFIGSPRMNYIDAKLLGRSDAKTIGIRPEHISIGHKTGDIQGVVSHVEHLGADTNIYLECGQAGLISIRLFGEHDHEVGSKLAAKFNSGRTYKFDQSGNTIV